MNVLMYTKRNCSFCDKAKMLLNIKGVSYTESVIGEDILREDFVATFPNVLSVPFILIDGNKIGGYEQLREYFDNKPSFIQD